MEKQSGWENLGLSPSIDNSGQMALDEYKIGV